MHRFCDELDGTNAQAEFILPIHKLFNMKRLSLVIVPIWIFNRSFTSSA